MSEMNRFEFSEDEWMRRLDEKVETLNELAPLVGRKFDNNWQNFGVRLVSKVLETGAEADLSRRYYYDETGEPDYDDYEEMLESIIHVLKEAKERGR